MPIYEFECQKCRKKFGTLVMSRARIGDVRCRFCGAAELERLWSRFASPKSDEARMDSLADPAALSGLDENDPASMARLMKKMGQEMGEDLGGDFDQALDESMAEGGDGLGAKPASDDL